jgi:hypothetical protein
VATSLATRQRIFPVLSALLWGMLLYLGARAYSRFPSSQLLSEQFNLYVLIPLVMTLISACLIVFSKRMPSFLTAIFCILLIAGLLPYLGYFTGGI